jgi:hypothetical protein
MSRDYKIEDEGSYIEFHLIEDGQQIGGGTIDIEPVGVDRALGYALGLCRGFVQAGGVWGGDRPI